jgi:glycosyltransferase involved in cell wall biosynthesis
MEQTQSIVIDPTLPAIRLTALVPGLNEAGRIGKVLEALQAVPLIDEIIVIDDGSTDHMLDEINQAAALDRRIRVIRHEINLGKGQSLFDALRSQNTERILIKRG